VLASASVGLHSLQVENRSIAGYSTGQSMWIILSQDTSEIERLEQKIRARMGYAGVSEPKVVLFRPEQAGLEGAPLLNRRLQRPPERAEVRARLTFRRSRKVLGAAHPTPVEARVDYLESSRSADCGHATIAAHARTRTL
jgi:hypothetical protein